MTRAFGDDQLELELRAVLHERAEEIASRARTAPEIAIAIGPRLRRAGVRSSGRVTALRLVAVGLVLLLLVAAAIAIGTRPSRPPVNLLLAVDLPFQGEPGAPPIVDAIRLAIRDHRGLSGATIELPPAGVFDDAVDGSGNPDRGAANMNRIVDDPRFVAVIGPYHSFVAEAAIPITNAAGLLECSPSNTSAGLTQGDAAASIRPRPDRPSYVRVASTDDAAAAAAARLLVGVLGKRSVYVVSTVEPFAGGRAQVFADAFEGLGGTIVGTAAIGDGGEDPGVVAGRIEDSGAQSVFYDGPSALGGRVLAGLSGASAGLPFVGLDIILDGPRSATGSFMQAAGANVANAYGVFPAGTDPKLGPQVQAAYAAAYGQPAENFVLSAYACATVILDGLARRDSERLGEPATWREALRAEVTAPGRRYETDVGTIEFDANGDAQPQRVSIYRGDPNAGDWLFSQMLELPPGG